MNPNRLHILLIFMLIPGILSFGCGTTSSTSTHSQTKSNNLPGSSNNNRNSSSRTSKGVERSKDRARAAHWLSKLAQKKQSTTIFSMEAKLRISQKTGNKPAKKTRSDIRIKRKNDRLFFHIETQSPKGNKNYTFGTDGKVFWVRTAGGDVRKRKLKRGHRLRLKKFEEMFHPFDITDLPNAHTSKSGVKIKRSSLGWSMDRKRKQTFLVGKESGEHHRVQVRLLLNTNRSTIRSKQYKIRVKAGETSRVSRYELKINNLDLSPKFPADTFSPPE